MNTSADFLFHRWLRVLKRNQTHFDKTAVFGQTQNIHNIVFAATVLIELDTSAQSLKRLLKEDSELGQVEAYSSAISLVGRNFFGEKKLGPPGGI